MVLQRLVNVISFRNANRLLIEYLTLITLFDLTGGVRLKRIPVEDEKSGRLTR